MCLVSSWLWICFSIFERLCLVLLILSFDLFEIRQRWTLTGSSSHPPPCLPAGASLLRRFDGFHSHRTLAKYQQIKWSKRRNAPKRPPPSLNPLPQPPPPPPVSRPAEWNHATGKGCDIVLFEKAPERVSHRRSARSSPWKANQRANAEVSAVALAAETDVETNEERGAPSWCLPCVERDRANR